MIKFVLPKGHRLETTYTKLDESVHYLTSSDYRNKWYVFSFVNGKWEKVMTSEDFIEIEGIV